MRQKVNGSPSHDTIQRVMGMISPDVLQQFYGKWQELLNRGEGELLKKIICIDGKTMRGNCRNDGVPSHVISAWSKEDGFCLGQKAVEEKSNEITAIPTNKIFGRSLELITFWQMIVRGYFVLKSAKECLAI